MDKLEETSRQLLASFDNPEVQYVTFERGADEWLMRRFTRNVSADEITRLTEALRQIGMIFERADESDGEKVRKAYRLVCQTLVARSSGKAGSDA